MNITIVGSGNVGRALAGGWKKAGPQRHVRGARSRWREGRGTEEGGLCGRAAGRRRQGRCDRARGAVDRHRGDREGARVLTGKIVIDAINPLTANLELALGFSDSAGETVARLASGAKVVKAFNTTGANNMANCEIPGWPPDDGGRGRRRGGEENRDGARRGFGLRAGRCRPARDEPPLEPMAMAWIKLAYAQGMGREFGFALLKR